MSLNKTKRCPDCYIEKPKEDFNKNRDKKDGLSGYCKTCRKVRTKKYREKYSDSIKKRKKRERLRNKEKYTEYYLKTKYNISIEDYNILYKYQNGGCAICGQENHSGRALAVDHDHITGKVRGLLCGSCNNGLGRFKDNVTLLSTAIEYLTGKGWGDKKND